jgi:hypothetical protein
MLDKYIKIESDKYEARQNSDGIWICIRLRANTIKELDINIGEVNVILNKYNQNNGKKIKKKEPTVKGLDNAN